MKNNGKCCICGRNFDLNHSHNPWPLRKESFFGETGNRCCAECNSKYVLNARIACVVAPKEAGLTPQSIFNRFKGMSQKELKQVLDS